MKLSGQTIIILALARFDSNIESTSYTIAKKLSENNTVFYVDNPFTTKDKFDKHCKRQLKKRETVTDGVIETELPNLKIIISPVLPPINFLPEGKIYRAALKFNENQLYKQIRNVIKKHGSKDYIYINSHNFHYPGLAEKLRPSCSIYHCVDPLIVPYDRKHGIISEKRLVESSNAVICTSKQLYEEKKLINANTYFVANAADIKHSNKALDATLIIADELKAIQGPIIGYFGAIERRIDFGLLKEVIEKNRDKQFVFVGPVKDEYIPSWFKTNQNLFIIGRVPYNNMPAILKGFHVAMIPFKKDEVSRTIFPLKLFEYLGAGKPVIATDFNPDLESFTNGTVSYCSTAEQFSDAIAKALKENSLPDIEKRLKVANENTWDKRAAEFESIIASTIKSIRQ